jgi:hypothetical protein
MKRHLAILFVFLMLASCGGGGDGGSETRFFGGVWTGSASLALNTCSLPIAQQVQGSFPHTVNQMDTEVVLDEVDGTTWAGVVEGASGFLVGRSLPTTEISTGVFCSANSGIRYSDIQGDNGSVLFAIALTCARGSERVNCEVGYTGTVRRTS